MRRGRPPLSREPLFEAINRIPRAGRNLRHVSARDLAKALGHDPQTIGIMLMDLENAGRVKRKRRKGRRGILVEILDHDY